ncbi:MAG: ribonuclease HII [Asgard group archaeon]|nr:ribonuclease HII [Asgard group archaeon]
MNKAGIDEAGRGPVIGPLVIAGVVLPQEEIDKLVEMGIKDSKLLSKEKREQFFDVITVVAIDKKIEVIKAREIDRKQKKAINLNRLETDTMISILQSLTDWSEAYVDACDVNAERFQKTLEANCAGSITAEHRADLIYPVVSAASILAKVTRDNIIKAYHDEYGVDFGSGYPSDPKTNEFLEQYYLEHKSFPPIVRMCWETVNKIIEKNQQKNIDSFFTNK